ncbi:MAG: transporter [Ignavibacteria bacterium]|nr:transporter [Ignavibacteria bacterium]
MKKKILFILLFISFGNLYSQEIESIFTDRPDQSESPQALYKGFLQIESGLKYQSFHNDPALTDYALSVPEILIRYGLLKNLEVRLGMEYAYEKHFPGAEEFSGNSSSSSNNINGFRPPSLSIKYNFIKGEKFIPKTAVLVTTDVPGIGQESFRLKHFNPELKLAMNNELSEKFDITYNLGVSWDTEGRTKTGFYTLSLGYSPTQLASMFIESYTNYQNGSDPDYNIDFGFSFLVKNNTQVDIYYGQNTKLKPDYFIGGGFSVRFPK